MSLRSSTTTSVHVEGRVIRTGGRVEDLGTIAYWHRNPLRRLAWRLSQFLRGRRAGHITSGD